MILYPSQATITVQPMINGIPALQINEAYIRSCHLPLQHHQLLPDLHAPHLRQMIALIRVGRSMFSGRSLTMEEQLVAIADVLHKVSNLGYLGTGPDERVPRL